MKANAIRLYNYYCEMEKNPQGHNNIVRTEAKRMAKKGKKDMEEHFRTSPKYMNDPEILKILNKKNGEKST